MKWSHKSALGLISKDERIDPAEKIRELARNLVLKGYNLGWNGPPYDPIKLANLLEIDVLPNESINDARIIPYKNNSYKIEYNPYQRDTRINFSIAHEIGHTLFPDCEDQIHNREPLKNTDSWELEFLCDIAASEILLPYADFTIEANSVSPNIDNLLKISNKYKASVESVFLRFCEVIDKPCTIILAAFDSEKKKLNVEYSKASKQSVLSFEPGFSIPLTSISYECINPGWTAYEFEKWDCFGESRYFVNAIGLPPIKKQKNNRVGILIVPEHYRDEPEGKIHMVNGDATKPRGPGNKIIAQVINTSGGLGFGFGKSMSKAWPESKKSVVDWINNKASFKLGESKLTKLSYDTYVFQMISQKGIFPKGGVIPLKYDSLRECLKDLAVVAKDLNASVHMPQIGAGQAKGDWGIIEGTIYQELVSKGIDVCVYVLPGTKIIKPGNTSNLTLFDQ